MVLTLLPLPLSSTLPGALANAQIPANATLTAVGDVQVAVITPTVSGQIGINPVHITTPASTSILIGVDTKYFTQDGTSAKRLGHNESLMQELRQGSQQLVRVGGINTADLAAQGNVAVVGDVEVAREFLEVMVVEVNPETVIVGGLVSILLGMFLHASKADVPYKSEVPDPEPVLKYKLQQPNQDMNTCPKDFED
ncbi:uncharacterized protein LY79DRAFT_581942 [Colletotrichum navitas]|uniref:Uncharacterized protein n=1 Tax=Colletotrichum navitas TaxID=681940 RepID=A0AAD8PT24_9PEZI|nr:uncharacterized protein LY79DRAFT_581942 [Colletotrichum navitas]KAK1580189.1 hypothetical protein LY79DRAFT_581942 [Colletotrichum navitas]